MRTFYIHSLIAFVASYLYFRDQNVLLPYNAETASAVFLGVYLVLWLSAWFYHRNYFYKIPKVVNFLIYFIKELLISNFKIAYDILTPRYYMRPTIIAVPLSIKSDLGITLLANIITLTPGTLSIDVRDDKKILYIHALYVKGNDVERLKKHIKLGLERRLQELLT